MQRFFRFVLCAVCVCICGTQVCFSQKDDSVPSLRKLAEVEILDSLGGEVSHSGVPQQVVKADDIARLGLVDVADAMKRMAGVQVQDYGGLGGLKSVSVRGLGAKHTAVSYDGVPVLDAQSGQVDVGRFLLENVESVALVTGQGNDIFLPARSFASSGGVEIVAKKPLATATDFKILAGSYGLKGGSFAHRRVLNRCWSFSAVANIQKADGDYPFTLLNGAFSSKEHRVNGYAKNLSVEGNVFGNFGDKGSLQVKLFYYDSQRGLPGSVKLYNTDNKEHLWENNSFVQATYKVPLNEAIMLRASAKYNYSFTRYIDVNENYSTGCVEDRNRQNEFYASLGLKYLLLRGFSFVVTSDISSASLANNFADSKSPVRLNSQTVVAAQYENKVFVATASLLGTFVRDELENTPSPDDRKRLSPALALSWQPFETLPMRVRLSFKDAYRVPTLADLYYLRMGNVGLKPERATQFNAGLSFLGALHKRVNLSLTVDGYYNKVKDKIVALPTMYIWRMQNYGRVDIKGVDVTAALRMSMPCENELLLDISYSYIRAADRTKKTSKNYNHQIPYTPRNTLTSSVTFNNRLLNVSYLFTAVGERYMLPQNTPENRMGSYVEHTILVNREFVLGRGCVLRLQGEAINITDENYEIIRFYPMPGRQWRLSAKFSF